MKAITNGLASAGTYSIAAAAAALLLSATSASAQFHATQDPDGNTIVLDTNGQEVSIALTDPVGTRPDNCPIGSYYVSEVQTDKTELVLSDCAMGQQQFTVEMTQQPGGQTE